MAQIDGIHKDLACARVVIAQAFCESHRGFVVGFDQIDRHTSRRENMLGAGSGNAAPPTAAGGHPNRYDIHFLQTSAIAS